MFFRKRPEEVKTRLLYQFIEKRDRQYPVNEMCIVLAVSESGYYRYKKSKTKPRRENALLVAINKILAQHPDNDNYGRERMMLALEQQGVHVSERTVYRVMKKYGLTHKAKRRPNGITKEDSEAHKS